MESIRHAIGAFLGRLGLRADVVTLLGLATAGLAGWSAYQGRFMAAAAWLLLSGILDLLDGAIARATGTVSPYGGILDSSLDRYGDAFVFCGLLFYYASVMQPVYSLLAFSALVGAFNTSYVRARAECVISKCRVGFWERGERITCLILALALGKLPAGLWMLGTLTHFTALYRLVYAAAPKRFDPIFAAPPAWRNFLLDTRRMTPFFPLKALILLALLVWWTPPL